MKSFHDFSLQKQAMTYKKIWPWGIPVYSTTYDFTTPVQVVNAAYDTSGNGGRKIVRLSNGWLVCCAVDTSSNILYFYKWQPPFSVGSWTQLCYINTALGNFSIVSLGTTVYTVFIGANTDPRFCSFDALTVTNTAQGTALITSVPTSTNKVSLAIDDNGYLYFAYDAKTATYSNSFNIYFSKSENEGGTWSTVEQVTVSNTSGVDNVEPCIIIDGNGDPKIFAMYRQAANNELAMFKKPSSSWVPVLVYDGTSYAQYEPSSIVQQYGANAGRIEVSWRGYLAGVTYQELYYAYSDDNGSTWSTAERVTTTGNTFRVESPSNGVDVDGNLYVAYKGKTGASDVVKLIKNTNGSWGSSEDISGSGASNPSICSNHFNFTKPLTIWKTSSDVKFYGKWIS